MSNAAGIDVSKAHLDAALAAGPSRRFPNDDSGIAALLEWLESRDAGKAVYEPAGGYELPLAEGLRQAGLPAYKGPSQQGAGLRPSLRTVGQDRPPRRSGPVPLRGRF